MTTTMSSPVSSMTFEELGRKMEYFADKGSIVLRLLQRLEAIDSQIEQLPRSFRCRVELQQAVQDWATATSHFYASTVAMVDFLKSMQDKARNPPSERRSVAAQELEAESYENLMLTIKNRGSDSMIALLRTHHICLSIQSEPDWYRIADLDNCLAMKV